MGTSSETSSSLQRSDGNDSDMVMWESENDRYAASEILEHDEDNLPPCASWDLTIQSLDSAFSASNISIATTASGMTSGNEDDSSKQSVSIVDAHAAGLLGSTLQLNELIDEHMSENQASSHVDSALSRGAQTSANRSSIARDGTSASLNSRTISSYGRTIDENHVNYVLMYDMLTGIRHSVSVCQAKNSRSLTKDDFKQAKTYNFMNDNYETAPSRYEFRFKDYCPWVFRSLREAFKIDAADFLVSLTGKYALSEIVSPGKSGSLFYFSQDFRYIIKTVSKSEHLFLRKILRNYYDHIKRNPNSLLTRFYGLYRVRVSHVRKIYFVVMGNIFPPHKDIHETYDLKGSTHGRHVGSYELQNIELVTLKDLNWTERNRKLKLGPVKATELMNQLISDCTFLTKMKIMDYSLLCGIHYMSRGNEDHIRDRSMMMLEPVVDDVHNDEDVDGVNQQDNEGHRSDAGKSRLGTPVFKASTLTPSCAGDIAGVPRERRMCVFYNDDGGFRSTSRDGTPGDEIYYIGIIDILTPYSMGKRFEHVFKSIALDRRTISAVNPADYSKRFLKFMAENILQDTSADYSTKPLPALPTPKFQTCTMDDGFDYTIILEQSDEEDDDDEDAELGTGNSAQNQQDIDDDDLYHDDSEAFKKGTRKKNQ